MKRIVLLNGASSSGKSTIAKELSNRINGSIIISIDDYLKMSNDEPIWEDDVFDIMPSMVGDILKDNDRTLIIDHVITSKRIFEFIINSINNEELLLVNVVCDKSILIEREKARGNRCIGSSIASLDYLYPKDSYDLVIDTSINGVKANCDVICSRLFNYDATFKINNSNYKVYGNTAHELLEGVNRIQNLVNLLNMGYGFCVNAEIPILENLANILNKDENGVLTIEDIRNIKIHLTIGDIECLEVVFTE